jgi:hypothetical protein
VVLHRDTQVMLFHSLDRYLIGTGNGLGLETAAVNIRCSYQGVVRHSVVLAIGCGKRRCAPILSDICNVDSSLVNGYVTVQC